MTGSWWVTGSWLLTVTPGRVRSIGSLPDSCRSSTRCCSISCCFCFSSSSFCSYKILKIKICSSFCSFKTINIKNLLLFLLSGAPGGGEWKIYIPEIFCSFCQGYIYFPNFGKKYAEKIIYREGSPIIFPTSPNQLKQAV